MRPTGPADSANTALRPRVELLAAIALSLWILLLHGLFLFHAGPLWRDEVGTIDFASMPTLSDIWHNLQYDNFPPLFVGVARVWTLAGLSGDFSYRLLGFLIGAGTLGVFWFGARRCGAGAPLLALALYAVNPLAVRVGDAMRPYGLGFALNLLALTLTWRFVENPRARSWFWATLAAVLSVQCLYQNAFFLAAFCLAGCAVTLARRQWKTAAQTVGIGVVSALSLLPHWGNIIKARDWQGIGWHPVRLDEIGNALVEALNASGPWLVWFWAGLALLAVGTALVFGDSLAGLADGLLWRRPAGRRALLRAFSGKNRAATALLVFPDPAGARGSGHGRHPGRPGRSGDAPGPGGPGPAPGGLLPFPLAMPPCKSANPMPTWWRRRSNKKPAPAI